MTDMILPMMIEKQRGLILNMSSNVAEHPTGFLASYSSAKAFILNLSQTLYHECLSKNVLVFALTPLFIHSQLVAFRPTIFIPSSKCYVHSALKSINWNNTFSCGYPIHRLQSELVRFVSIIFGERFSVLFGLNFYHYILKSNHNREFAESGNEFFKLLFT
ncbi:hypothetical protein BLA29_008651, partial [Euroglyphus maynei]